MKIRLDLQNSVKGGVATAFWKPYKFRKFVNLAKLANFSTYLHPINILGILITTLFGQICKITNTKI